MQPVGRRGIRDSYDCFIRDHVLFYFYFLRNYGGCYHGHYAWPLRVRQAGAAASEPGWHVHLRDDGVACSQRQRIRGQLPVRRLHRLLRGRMPAALPAAAALAATSIAAAIAAAAIAAAIAAAALTSAAIAAAAIAAAVAATALTAAASAFQLRANCQPYRYRRPYLCWARTAIVRTTMCATQFHMQRPDESDVPQPLRGARRKPDHGPVRSAASVARQSDRPPTCLPHVPPCRRPILRIQWPYLLRTAAGPTTTLATAALATTVL